MSTFADLTQALARARSEAQAACDQGVREAEKTITGLRAACKGKLEQLDHEHASELTRREQELAKAARTELGALCNEWRKQPTRELASGLADSWRALTSRCQDQLGKALGAHHVSLAMIGDNPGEGHMAVIKGGPEGAGEHAHRVVKAIEAGGIAAIESALTALETRIDALHGRPITAQAKARLGAIASRASHQAAVAAYQQMQADEAAEAQRQFVESYVPPKNAHVA